MRRLFASLAARLLGLYAALLLLLAVAGGQVISSLHTISSNAHHTEERVAGNKLASRFGLELQVLRGEVAMMPERIVRNEAVEPARMLANTAAAAAALAAWLEAEGQSETAARLEALQARLPGHLDRLRNLAINARDVNAIAQNALAVLPASVTRLSQALVDLGTAESLAAARDLDRMAPEAIASAVDFFMLLDGASQTRAAAAVTDLVPLLDRVKAAMAGLTRKEQQVLKFASRDRDILFSAIMARHGVNEGYDVDAGRAQADFDTLQALAGEIAHGAEEAKNAAVAGILSEVDAAKGVLALCLVSALAAMALGALYTMRGIVRPMRRLVATTKALARGDLDVPIATAPQVAEVTAMNEALRVFRANALERRTLQARQEEARAGQARREDEMRGAIAAFEAEAQALLSEVADAMAQVETSAGNVLNLASGAQERTGSVLAISSDTSMSVANVSRSAETLSASISEISQRTSQSVKVAGLAMERAQEANVFIDRLSASTRQIGEIATLISDIAEQTNLLALNAAIEAARAGEAGRGFAVVAAEVKALASQTSSATSRIERRIKEIADGTRSAVGAIGQILDTMEEMNTYTVSIAGAVEEQTLSTSQIVDNVSSAEEGTQLVAVDLDGVSVAISETSVRARGVLALSRSAADKNQGLKTSVEGFLARIRQIA